MVHFARFADWGGNRNRMFYRRKILLGLLEGLDRPVSKVDLQKYLFLVCQSQAQPSYHFVPYKFGCYSFQAQADKSALTKYGILRNIEKWEIEGNTGFRQLLTSEDRGAVCKVVERFGKMHGRKLVRHVYQSFPYYAINSEIQHEILDARERKRVAEMRPRPGSSRLFTIGYEGQALEQYLNKLIGHSVRVLCDVRRNPVSMKFGFSKRLLQNACSGLGIRYLHMPQLGIESSKRKHLQSRQDYRVLFRDYVRTTLKDNHEALGEIVQLMRDYKRVALTCFEADAGQCHRACVAQALEARPSFNFVVAHL